jgi:glycosyltransferase involved in cell wall biosynthesis
MVYVLKQLSEKKISLIHNGSACGIAWNQNNIGRDRLRKDLGFKDSDFIVAFIGRLAKRKGFNFSIDVWEKFFANKAGFKFLVYGNLESIQTSRLKKLKNIFYMGFSNDIPNILQSIDCVILPSKHEGLSYISLEATLYKCPVICSYVPGLREIIKNNISGLVVNRDYASYAKAIRRLQIKKLDKHAQEKYSKEIYRKYNQDSFSRAYIKFLRERICITNP